MAVEINGGTPKVVSSSVNYLGNVLVDATSIYWTDSVEPEGHSEGKLKKLAK
jgi:hypothetical protein